MDDSPLNKRLPPELRLRIYEWVAAGSVLNLENFKEGGAVLQVCSQMRREARILVFANATVQMGEAYFDAKWFRQSVQTSALVRTTAVDLANVFGLDVLNAISDRTIVINLSVLQRTIRRRYLPYLRTDCPQCVPWISNGAMLELQEQCPEKAMEQTDENARNSGTVDRRGRRITSDESCDTTHKPYRFEDEST